MFLIYSLSITCNLMQATRILFIVPQFYAFDKLKYVIYINSKTKIKNKTPWWRNW